jgi:hypothetical protein
MKITNELGLPEAIVNAIRSDDYEPGHADISVTSLISPPQKRAIEKQHRDQIVQDASDMLWALMGKAMHKILEDGADPDAEHEVRYYATHDDYVISGQFDRYDLESGTLQDYKFSSVWEYIYGLKHERIAQLNVLAWLLRENGMTVNEIEVVFLFRDWSKSKAKFDQSYPQHQMERIKVDMWSEDQVHNFLSKRLEAHFVTIPVPQCSDEDRWAKPTKYAVMKKGRKSAVRVLDSAVDATQYIETMKDQSPYSIEVRPGENTRCEYYCAAAPFCPQFKALKGE